MVGLITIKRVSIVSIDVSTWPYIIKSSHHTCTSWSIIFISLVSILIKTNTTNINYIVASIKDIDNFIFKWFCPLHNLHHMVTSWFYIPLIWLSYQKTSLKKSYLFSVTLAHGLQVIWHINRKNKFKSVIE